MCISFWPSNSLSENLTKGNKDAGKDVYQSTVRNSEKLEIAYVSNKNE